MARKCICLFVGVILVSLAVGTARANTITGSLWENATAGAGDAIPSNVPGTSPDVTFTAPTPIDFCSAVGTCSSTPYTIGGFLGFGGATILTGSSELGKTLLNTMIKITGSVAVTNGEKFSAGHDDGLTLTIGSTDLGFNPGPTGPTITTVTYGGPSGTFPFELDYGECCGPPAELFIDLALSSPSPTPEPSSLLLLSSGLLGLGPIVRRRFLR